MKRFARFATLIVGLMVVMPVAVSAGPSVMVPYSQFKKWSDPKKIEYFRELRKAAGYIEKAMAKEYPFSASNQYQFGVPSLFPEAWAEEGRFCLIGGVRRTLKPNASGKMVCKWDGRGTERGCKAGEFRCGSIYNDACVKADVNVTDNCIAAAGDTIPDEKAYNERREAMEKIAISCQNGDINSRFDENCQKFLKRLQVIQNAYGAGPAITPPPGDTSPPAVTPPPEVTPPPAGSDEGVPAIEEFGGNNDPIPEDPADEKGEKGEKGESTVPAPEVRPPPEVVEVTPEPPRDDCMSRNRTKLGELACIACGLEEWNPADVLQQGGGATKWVALIGIMAQTYHGPYNPGNSGSKDLYLTRVAEMISAYGYCTDNEYPMSLPNETRNWLDGSSTLATKGPDQTKFASGFGLMSSKKALFANHVQNANRPMYYAKEIFDVGNGWEKRNPQNHQWRFRSMIKAHYSNYPETSFSRCAVRAEARMKNLDSQKMCPIREGTTASGGRGVAYTKKMQPHEFGKNESFYAKLVGRCGVKVRNRFPNYTCDNGCKESRVLVGSVGHMKYCKPVSCPDCDKGDEPEGPRPPSGKGGEPSNDDRPEPEGDRDTGGKASEDSSTRD